MPEKPPKNARKMPGKCARNAPTCRAIRRKNADKYEKAKKKYRGKMRRNLQKKSVTKRAKTKRNEKICCAK